MAAKSEENMRGKPSSIIRAACKLQFSKSQFLTPNLDEIPKRLNLERLSIKESNIEDVSDAEYDINPFKAKKNSSEMYIIYPNLLPENSANSMLK